MTQGTVPNFHQGIGLIDSSGTLFSVGNIGDKRIAVPKIE